MRTVLAILFVVCSATACQAELRIIGIKVTRTSDPTPKTRVSIYSDVGTENKRDIPIKDAVKILAAAEGWGSRVEVGIVADDVPLGNYLPLLDAIAKNLWLDLAFVDRAKPSFVNDNIRRRINAADTPESSAK